MYGWCRLSLHACPPTACLPAHSLPHTRVGRRPTDARIILPHSHLSSRRALSRRRRGRSPPHVLDGLPPLHKLCAVAPLAASGGGRGQGQPGRRWAGAVSACADRPSHQPGPPPAQPPPLFCAPSIFPSTQQRRFPGPAGAGSAAPPARPQHSRQSCSSPPEPGTPHNFARLPVLGVCKRHALRVPGVPRILGRLHLHRTAAAQCVERRLRLMGGRGYGQITRSTGNGSQTVFRGQGTLAFCRAVSVLKGGRGGRDIGTDV